VSDDPAEARDGATDTPGGHAPEGDGLGEQPVGGATDDGDPNSVAHLERALRDYDLFQWLNIDIVSVEPGHAVLDLPFDDKFANISSGTVHGGITATVIDTASGFALRSTFEEPAAAALTTTDMNVRYIRPARGDLRVDAEVVRSGSSMGVTECEVTTVHEGERKVVATGGTTYRLFRNAGEAAAAEPGREAAAPADAFPDTEADGDSAANADAEGDQR
jgi:uncharacterized protein (TIGR00369 family)